MVPPAPIPTDPGPRDNVSANVLAAAVLALAGLLYLPTLRFPFVYDDGWTLVSNGFLRHPDHLTRLWTGEAATLHVPDAFRPALVVFDTAMYQLLGLRPALHHAVSVALHVATCAGLARYLSRLGAPLAERLAATALFGVMAVHAEAVAVISFREDLLAASLGLLALALAEAGTRKPASQWAATSLAAALAMLLASSSKLAAAPLPGLWLLAHRLAPWRPATSWPRSLTTATVLLVAAALPIGHRFILYGDVSPYGETSRVLAQSVGLSSVLAASTQIHLGYIQQLLVPFGLSPEYVDRSASWTDPATILALAAIMSLIAYGTWCAIGRRRPIVALGILGAGLLALPTSNLFPMPNMRADRFMYLPSVPVAIAVAVGLLAIGRRLAYQRTAREWVIVPLLIVGVVHGALGFAASASYANNATLWQVAVTRAPDSARAQALRGIQRIIAGSDRASLDEALLALGRANCRLAARLDPNEELAHVCWGRWHMAHRDWPAAHRSFSRALTHHGARPDLVLGTLAELTLDLPEAIANGTPTAAELLARGLREYPYSADLWATAARIHHRHGAPQTALFMVRTARSMRPERWETVLTAVELLLDIGDIAGAQRTMFEEYEVLGAADQSRYRAIAARLDRAQDFWPHSVIQPLLAPGVFPR